MISTKPLVIQLLGVNNKVSKQLRKRKLEVITYLEKLSFTKEPIS